MEYRDKNHINIINLLTKCEQRFQQLKDKTDWRLEQYIKSIFDMIEEEESKNDILNDELIAAKKKAKFFQGLIDAHSKSKTALEQYSIINSLQSNNSTTTTTIDNDTPMEENRIKLSETKQIHLSEIANCDKRMKKELFSKLNNNDNNENLLKQNSRNKNYDDIIKYHELLQKKITDEMVTLVGNLKQNLTTSNEIVKKDTELLEKTNRFTESNVSKLKKNTDKLREFANAACEYWLWISLTLVIFTFLSMVLLIRLFPKKATIIIVNNLAGQQEQQKQQYSFDSINNNFNYNINDKSKIEL